MAKKRYVLMKWKDGWREVVAIDGDALDLDKYYVIERKEYFGRLVFKRPEGEYPGLIIIDRAPMEIEQVLLTDGDIERNLKQVSTYAEGDRLEYNFELQNNQGKGLKEEVTNSIKEVLTKGGISAKDLLSQPEAQRFKEIEKVAKDAGIVGGRSQSDLVGFIETLLEEM
jgi:hypothetical protein